MCEHGEAGVLLNLRLLGGCCGSQEGWIQIWVYMHMGPQN